MSRADEIIKLFNMTPLTPEGGYFVETYRANEKLNETALPERYNGKKNFSTAILYLITRTHFRNFIGSKAMRYSTSIWATQSNAFTVR